MDIKENFYNIEYNLPVTLKKLGYYVRIAGVISVVLATSSVIISTIFEVKHGGLIALFIYLLSFLITNYIAFEKYSRKVKENINNSSEELEQCFLMGNINAKGVIKSQGKSVFKNMRIILNILIWDMAYIFLFVNYFLKAQVENYVFSLIATSFIVVCISLIIALKMKSIVVKSFEELFLYYANIK